MSSENLVRWRDAATMAEYESYTRRIDDDSEGSIQDRVEVSFTYSTFAGAIAKHLVRHDTIEGEHRFSERIPLLSAFNAPQKLGILGLFVVRLCFSCSPRVRGF